MDELIDADEVEPYTAATRQALEEATTALVASIKEYVASVAVMHGGSAEKPAFFDNTEALARLVAAWNERVFDHTGTMPLPLDLVDDEVLEDDEVFDVEDLGDVEAVTVVSRWDLAVADRTAVIAAGREAHRRDRPNETDEDAEFAVADVQRALRAIRHQAEELWFTIPGTEVLGGAQVYIRPEGPLAEVPAGPELVLDAVELPPGEIICSDVWR